MTSARGHIPTSSDTDFEQALVRLPYQGNKKSSTNVLTSFLFSNSHFEAFATASEFSSQLLFAQEPLEKRDGR